MAEKPKGFDEGFRALLTHLGEDPGRPGLDLTPSRVLDTMEYLTRGLREDIRDDVNGGIFPETSGDMVLVRKIEFVSLCEHHMLPFTGHAHVGYIPDGRVIGLSKIARVVDHFACRLQVQERLTGEIADFLSDVLKPRGLGVVMDAVHLCMVARGVRKQDSEVMSSAWRGSFASNHEAREEFLRGIG
ncbi:MAG: GTP cyclohydrolase I FolE, partial [Deltaproteobacteria bacterium]|nr:GTP cyclohydrolase I FolE [Deltaproteobacteria bacterium]